MRRTPYFAEKSPKIEVSSISEPFDPNKWLNTIQAALYLGKVTKEGKPSVGAIRNMVYRGLLTSYKPFGRLLFKRTELDLQVEASRKRRYPDGD